MTTYHLPRRRAGLPLALALASFCCAGCDISSGPTATGAKVAPAEANGVSDPGTINAGGPGPAPGQKPQ